MKKYVVELKPEQRTELEGLTKRGRPVSGSSREHSSFLLPLMGIQMR